MNENEGTAVFASNPESSRSINHFTDQSLEFRQIEAERLDKIGNELLSNLKE